MYNSFYNNGIIQSNNSSAFASLSPADNNGILIEPIISQAYVGQPIANALTLGSLANATVMGWYTDAGLSTPAGIYNATNNTFTPFSAAVGLTTLYIQIDLGYDINCNPQVFEVELNWPVQPLQGGGPITFGEGQPIGEWSVFPNPAKNHARISGLPEELATVQLFNAQGQALKTFNVEYTRQRQLDLNLEGLPVGTYWIKAGPEVRAIVVK